MQEFYKKALSALIFLVVADALLASFFVYQSHLTLSLLAPHQGGDRWRYVSNTDAAGGGTSTLHIDASSHEQLRYDFKLTETVQNAFAAAEMWRYDRQGRLAQMDLSRYSTISFFVKCAPASSFILAIVAFDDRISKVGEFLTYRMPQAYFSCNKQTAPVSLDLARLTIPDWLHHSQKGNIAHQEYRLDKVSKIVFGTTVKSPRNVDAHVEISELTLHGRDDRYIAALASILLANWILFGCWFFRAHSHALIASLDSRLQGDLPLVAYRQLTLEPFRDKEKASVLRFIATNYTDTELDLEAVVAGTGANRNKINEVLKAELGMTFTRYLNKLRLTEAARLLSEKSGAAVAEIAYLVGYGNVSYFNKLFKEEYGCAPKAFRSLSTRQEDLAGRPAPPAETAS